MANSDENQKWEDGAAAEQAQEKETLDFLRKHYPLRMLRIKRDFSWQAPETSCPVRR